MTVALLPPTMALCAREDILLLILLAPPCDSLVGSILDRLKAGGDKKGRGFLQNAPAMSSQWDSLDLDSLTLLEDLLTEEEYMQLRYLACHLVSIHKSNDGMIVAYVTWRVLRSWGYRDAIIVPALKRIRTVASTEEANKIVNRTFTDPETDKITAMITYVVVYPGLIQTDDAVPRKIIFPAITDLYMTPELDMPIYCMHKRNTLSPLASIP